MPFFRSQSCEEIQIGIAWPGKRYQIDVSPEIMIKDLKTKILELAQVPVEVQHLTYQGRSLKDQQKLRHYKVKHDTTIILTRLGVDISSASSRASKRLSIANKYNAMVDSLSLPAESGRYDPIDNSQMAASTREASKPNLDGLAINSFLDSWFSPKQSHQPTEQRAATTSQNPKIEPPTSAESPVSDNENSDPQPNAQSAPPSMESYKPHVPVAIPANPQRVDVLAALLQETPRVATEFAPTAGALEKEDDDQVIKFTVKFGKKEIKLKMNGNQDMWAVKLKLEAANVGRAGLMRLSHADGEEVEEDGTLAENDITNGSKLVVEVE